MRWFVRRRGLNPKEMKLMLISALAMLFLVSCGGGSGSNSSPSTKSNNGVAQKGPFSIGSNVVITELDAYGISTGSVIESKISSKSGKFSYGTVTTNPNTYYRIQVTGRFFDENTGSVSENEITLSTITNSPKNSSINVLTHWLSLRTDAQLAYDKTLKTSLDQSQQELLTIFGIENPNALDVTTSSVQLDEDNAMLLLLSGALMEASQKYKVSSQTIIDEVGEDFADDGQLSEKGDEWFIRLQALIKNNPSAHTKKYAKAINDKLGYDVSLDKKLPLLIPLASRPVANVPEELLAAPSETVTLDGSASHDSGEIINFTWFRVDQQTQYDIQVSDRFSATPTITVPDEATVLAAPNQEISLLYALVVTDVDKLTHTGVVKVTIRIPPPLNNAPVANSQVLVTDEDTQLSITLTADDPDGDSINFILGTPLATSNGIVELDTSLPNIIYTPTQDYFGTDSFTFLVNDGFANSNTATVDIQVNPVNDPPVAVAVLGNVQTVESSQPVTLDGSASYDVDGTVEVYNWQQTAGSLVGLSTTSISNRSFIAPTVSSTPVTLTFDLIVTDNDGAPSKVDSVDVVVNQATAGNQPPIAIATFNGTSPFNELTEVELFGEESSDDVGIETYLWEQTSGPTVTLIPNKNAKNPKFLAPPVSSTSLTLKFKLTVADNDGATASDFVEIDIVDVVILNTPPTAYAGPDLLIGSRTTSFGGGSIQQTAPLTLDGSGSSDTEDDSNNIPLSYAWTWQSGPVMVDIDDLVNPVININGVSPDNINGEYVFSLVVSDSGNLPSMPDELIIIVRSNQPPVASDLIRALDPVGNPIDITLEGDDSDGNNDNIVYFIDTLPSTGRLSSGGILITAPGVITGNTIEYEPFIGTPVPDSFTYIVADELAATSNIATVDITEPNDPPRAHAGFNGSVPIAETATPTSILQTAIINLDGTRSSDNEDASVDLIYQWTQKSGPITIPLGDIPQVREPSFEITNTNVSQTLTGSYEFELKVTDTGGLTSAIDLVVINASLPNPVVIALPGEDRDELEFTIVQLYGSGTAPQGVDNSTRAWEWTQVDVIPGTEIDLVFDPTYELYTPTFIAPAVTVATEIKLQLIVFDNEFGFSEPAVVIITIYPTSAAPLDNIKPTAVDQNISMNANGSGVLFALIGLGDDPDGDNLGLTYEIIGFNNPGQGLNDPGQGSIRSQTRNFVYTPLYTPTNPVVENSLIYVAIDQDGAESDPATVTFTPIVSPPGNAAPVAQDITINIDAPPTTSNSLQLLSYATMIQDAEDDQYLIDVDTLTNDTQVQFRLTSGNLRMDNRSRTTAGTGTFVYRAIDIYGNVSNTATITINYND